MSSENVATQSTVVFVDLVRFTSLTDVHGDLVGADAAVALEAIAHQRSGPLVDVVKTAGDGVLFRATGAAEGLRCAAAVIEDVHDLGLDARAGAHDGPVIVRNGDIFGSTVNLASRLTALAQPGMIAMTRPVALEAAGAGLVVVPQGWVEVKGFQELVELFTADPCRHGTDSLDDPVCGMRVTRESVVSPLSERDGRIGFCSSTCADIFAKNPDRYVPTTE